MSAPAAPSTPPTLRGRRIAVTRPAEQCAALGTAIRERGGEALVVPLIVIEPIIDSPRIRETCDRLDDFHLAFFVSPSAIAHGLSAVRRHRDWPAALAVATVGQGSRRALEAEGFTQVIAPTEGADSEAVLALPEFQAERLAGRRLLVLRGDGGRDLLGDTARSRGAQVSYLSCYRRRIPERGGEVLLEAARAGHLDALLLTSSEAAANLGTLLGRSGLAALADIPAFVPHARIAAAAAALGLRRVFITPPGDAGLLAALDAHFGHLG